jgi:hypothetical protein
MDDGVGGEDVESWGFGGLCGQVLRSRVRMASSTTRSSRVTGRAGSLDVGRAWPGSRSSVGGLSLTRKPVELGRDSGIQSISHCH